MGNATLLTLNLKVLAFLGWHLECFMFKFIVVVHR